jgi:hypothetical protein
MSTDTELQVDQEVSGAKNADAADVAASGAVNEPVISVADEMRAQLDALEVPPNIDSRLLELWLYRERQEIEKRERVERKRYLPPRSRSLGRLFAAYIGIVVMVTVIVLGLVQGKEVNEILINACIAFLIYTVIGFLIGRLVEGCVSNSVETIIREIIKRNEPAENKTTEETA